MLDRVTDGVRGTGARGGDAGQLGGGGRGRGLNEGDQKENSFRNICYSLNLFVQGRGFRGGFQDGILVV